MGHRHRRRCGERAVDAGERVVDQAAQFVRGLLEGRGRVGGGAGHGVAGGVVQVTWVRVIGISWCKARGEVALVCSRSP